MFTIRQNWFGWFEVVYPKGTAQAGLTHSSHPNRESAEKEATRINQGGTR